MLNHTNFKKHLSFGKIKNKFVLNNIIQKYFSLSMKNLQQKNIQLNKKNYLATFYSDELQIEEYKKTIPANSKENISYEHTDLIFEVDFNETTGWKTPKISGYHKFEIDPKNSVLHYAVQTFEGISARRSTTKDGGVLLFRPECYIQRLKASADRLGFPQFDANELLSCMKTLIRLEKDHIPKGVDDFLYIRPTYISMTDQLGVLPATSSKLFIIMSPINSKQTNPIKVYCPQDITKKYPQAFGHLNLGSNIGPILDQLKIAKEKGYDDVLFLLNDNITELTDMNVFVFWENKNGKKELVTPALDGSVLPGITRDSIIKLTKERGINVTERHISIKELINSINSNKMLEIFGASTFNGLTSIREIHFDNQAYKLLGDLNLNKRTEFCQSIHDCLMKIKLGEEQHPWVSTLE